MLKNYSMCSSNVIARAQQLKIGSNDPRSSYQNPPKQWQKNACILLLSGVDRPLGHIELKVCSSMYNLDYQKCHIWLLLQSLFWILFQIVAYQKYSNMWISDCSGMIFSSKYKRWPFDWPKLTWHSISSSLVVQTVCSIYF